MNVRIVAGKHAKTTRIWVDDLEITSVTGKIVVTLDSHDASRIELQLVPEVVTITADVEEIDTSRRVLMVTKP